MEHYLFLKKLNLKTMENKMITANKAMLTAVLTALIVISFQSRIEANADISPTPEQISAAEYMTGFEYYNRGGVKVALKHFKKAVKISPTHITASLMIGFSLEKCGEFEKSLNTIESTLQRTGKTIPFRKNISEFYNKYGMHLVIAEKNPAAGITYFIKSIKLVLNNDQARRNLGIAFCMLAKQCREKGDISGADKYYKKATFVHPEFRKTKTAKAGLAALSF